MPASVAKRICPQLIMVKTRMNHYAEISRQIRSIFMRYTSLVEPLSLDEAFLDVSDSEKLFGDACSIARQIKRAIKDEVGLIASAGIAPNKFLAKLASDLEKPDGFVIVDPDHVQEFLDPLEISRVWGIGKQGQKKFEAIGVRRIGQLRSLPIETLKARFGVNGDHFWRLARGLDTRPVVPDRDAKSISHETTFAADIDDRDTLCAWVLELSEQVTRRMRRYEIRGKTVKLKIRFSDFRTISRSVTLDQPTNVTRELWDVARSIICEVIAEQHEPVRLIGVGMANLTTSAWRQRSLFDEEDHVRDQHLDSATDAIRDKFGLDSVRPASSMEHQVRHRAEPRPNDDPIE